MVRFNPKLDTSSTRLPPPFIPPNGGQKAPAQFNEPAIVDPFQANGEQGQVCPELNGIESIVGNIAKDEEGKQLLQRVKDYIEKGLYIMDSFYLYVDQRDSCGL